MRAPRAFLLPLIHVPAFLLLSLGWSVALGVAFAIWLVAAGNVDPAQMMGLLDATWTGLLTIVQILGFVAAALGLSLFLPRAVPPIVSIPRSASERRQRLGAAMALRRAPWPWTFAGVLGAAVMWTFPSWLAEQLIAHFPDWPSMMEQLSKMLVDADPVGFVVLSVAIVVAAPLFEEIIFRGYVWRVFELGLGRGAAFVGSTLLFAIYHLDPLHVVALLPTAAFFGWLRLRSNSLVPCILAHFVNNGLALVLTMFPTDPSVHLPLWFAVGGLAVGLGFVGLAEALVRRRP